MQRCYGEHSCAMPVCFAQQVHGGKLHDGRRFAMKIQYPGVARSIESDVDNLMRLINIANLLPKGLYVEQAAEVRPAYSVLPMLQTIMLMIAFTMSRPIATVIKSEFSRLQFQNRRPAA